MNSNEEEGEMSDCVQPDAPWVACVICGKFVKTCECEELPDEADVFEPADYVCPEHPDGCELSNGLGWVCSGECWVVAARKADEPWTREPFEDCENYDWTNGGRDCIGRGMECCAGCGG
jgi:hypothetical protein